MPSNFETQENTTSFTPDREHLASFIEVTEPVDQAVSERLAVKASKATEATERIAGMAEVKPDSETLQAELGGIRDRLLEPSLVGLAIPEELLSTETQSIQKLFDLAEQHQLSLGDRDREMNRLQDDREDMKNLFFEHLESPNSLYWHFTRRGLDILEKGELRSHAAGAPDNTGNGTEGVHFVKPGIGMETDTGYNGYTSEVSPRVDPEIRQFGMAVIYRAGDIHKVTEYRDEPIEDQHRKLANVSQDVTFRGPDESPEYAYPLGDAYILPLADREQLNVLLANPDYARFSDESKSAAEIGHDIVVDKMQQAGYDEDWIQKHVVRTHEILDSQLLESDGLEDYWESERTIYADVGRSIRSGFAPDTEILVPLTATKGVYEHHDGSSPEGEVNYWKERIVSLPIRSEAAA